MSKGAIVGAALAPHPPHLVYAENPEQNEPHSEGGWEQLRWGYERLRDSLKDIEYDVIVLLSPHWQTYVGTHFLGVERFQSLSVDPIFPNLFRFHYDMNVDVELSKAIHDVAKADGMSVKMMENPDFRVDYGTIVSCHMIRPEWDKPVVAISSNRSRHYYSVEVMQEMMMQLGESTRKAIEASGKRALIIASNSLSHRHFTTESEVPEDMSKEHITSHAMYLWDMRMIELMKSGKAQEVLDMMPEFVEQSIAEADGGALTWMLSALEIPNAPAILHGYGTIIGTGNAIMEWKVGGGDSE
ncbi:MAG: tRNA U-34 5-methylaminomethyl-2-thiouridine biosynthesis protein [Euryarchaeota archaeon]|nr:tRNA U-34 5-methylaminomethyl-2-thiouridine biosynthesis protein [Euryarchaeota archaeon]